MKDCGCPEWLGKCDYRYKSKCKNLGLCGYQREPDITRSVKPKPTLEEQAKQDCSSCDHKTVCKYKEKFETMKKEHFPLLCVCQWYKKENDICTE